MSPPFDSVRDQLLRAGIAPRHVRRYVLELQEHLADLTARERGAGFDASAAAQRALALLGTEAPLVQSMIDKTPALSGGPQPLGGVFGTAGRAAGSGPGNHCRIDDASARAGACGVAGQRSQHLQRHHFGCELRR